jgi:hypothetical protein
LRCEPLEHIPPSKQKIIDQLLDNQIVKVNDYVNEHRNIAINLKRLNDGRQLNRKEQQKTVSWKRFNWDLNNPKTECHRLRIKAERKWTEREIILYRSHKRGKQQLVCFKIGIKATEFNQLAIIETNVKAIQHCYRYSIYQKSWALQNRKSRMPCSRSNKVKFDGVS